MTCYSGDNWKYVKGSDKKYKIYYDGRVWISTRKRFAITHCDVDYTRVWMDGKLKKVHILIAEHFIKKPRTDEKLEVRFVDDDKRNCHGDNLFWVTHTENMHDRLFGKKRGVRAKGNRFVAMITHKKKSIYLGCFDNEDDAYQAYYDAFYDIHTEVPW